LFDYSSIEKYHWSLLQGNITCVESVEHFLKKIKAAEHLNAFVHVYDDEALLQAAELDRKRKAGHPAGRLHGVVVAIKDVICYKDHPVSAASGILQNFSSIYSATVIERLLKEEAIIIGNCNCDEFAMGSTNENSVYGKVLNSVTKEPIQANITYRLLETDEEVGIASSDPKDGSYKIILPAGQTYSFMAIKENIYTESENIDLKDIKEYKEIERNLYLVPIQVGSRVVLNNLFFVSGKTDINPTSYPELDRLIDVMKKHKQMEIEIAGHTDNVGSDKINNELSLKRANAVKDYLTGKGVEASRLTAKGYGKTKPVAPNTTEDGKKKNRRVDFTILKL